MNSIKDERTMYEYEDTPDNESDSEESHHDKNDENGNKKKYSVISQAVREKFINRVMSKEVTIKEAAKEFGLKFSTSKAILQTYKKEGRIGKKKNRERKTKVVNVVFVCNVNPVNPYGSSIFPIVSVSEIKGSKTNASIEDNKNKLLDQALTTYPEHKVVHQTNLQIPNDSSKTTQQIIKEMGNDFLKDFIEKNFSGNMMGSVNSMNGGGIGISAGNGLNSGMGQSSVGMGNTSTMSSVINLNNFSNMPPPHLNSMSSLNNGGYNNQQLFDLSNDMSMGNPHLRQLNQPSPNQMNSMQMNQKRSFQTYERDTIPELELKHEQITDMSVKKFKSGEDLWDDMDRSKRDLEDFIYKTQNAIKNNTFVGKSVTFDFSKYKDDFTD